MGEWYRLLLEVCLKLYTYYISHESLVFLSNATALGANVLALKSLGWSPVSFFLYQRDISVPPMNNLARSYASG